MILIIIIIIMCNESNDVCENDILCNINVYDILIILIIMMKII